MILRFRRRRRDRLALAAARVLKDRDNRQIARRDPARLGYMIADEILAQPGWRPPKQLAVVPAVAAVAALPATKPHHHRHGCRKLFSVGMGERAARTVYRDGHRATTRNLRMLGRIEMCQRNPAAQWFVRWYDRRQAKLQAQRAQAAQLTGYVVTGGVSTFGPPLDPAGTTADGGSDTRPCIALKDTSTLDHMFRVTINGHTADLLHCDSGPYAGNRQIDVTGAGAYAMGLDPYNFPTDSIGTAQELK
jgi:hypothetical protein